MVNRKVTFRILFVVTVLVGASLGCRTFTSIQEDAQALGTSVGEGKTLLETGQAVATQIGESGLQETAAAAMTQLAESGLKETIAAAATAVDESGVVETAQALLTEQGPGLLQTVQAVKTQLPGMQSQPPAGIPLMDGERSNYMASDQFVSYTINQDFQSVLDFYERQMPVNGWTRQENGSLVMGQTATIVFQKDGHTAFVAISVEPVTNRTAVVVTVQ